MQTYIVLLRGVMPTGKNRVPMAALREALTQAGFEGVATWIQSGNAIVRTPLSPLETADRVREIIRADIGPDLAVIVKTPEDIARVLKENPFANEEWQERVFYGLYNHPLDGEKSRTALQKDYGEDRMAFTGHAAYLFIPGSAARSKLNNALLEKVQGQSVTVRNRNTLMKMLEMAGGE